MSFDELFQALKPDIIPQLTETHLEIDLVKMSDSKLLIHQVKFIIDELIPAENIDPINPSGLEDIKLHLLGLVRIKLWSTVLQGHADMVEFRICHKSLYLASYRLTFEKNHITRVY